MDCAIEGCEKLAQRGLKSGWCAMHYARWRRHGDHTAVKRVLAARGSDAISYRSAHARVQSLHGKASDHVCCQCAEPAAEWAYTHDCPDEKSGWTGRRFAPYSTDPNRYVPMCKSCHATFDRNNSNRKELAQ